ncbi:MAG: methyltransferase domain-containing protein [Dinoroseobacter sp.]|nr:methyltransferase domain-containing protein [Dinoroseobacter sp.]
MVTAVLGDMHERMVFNRRVAVLSETLGNLVPDGSRMLDVGTGDGQIAKLIAAHATSVDVEGIDIMKRPTTHIPVTLFDGTVIPHEDKSFDVVSFVDVLHHTDDPEALLKEASRVARRAVIIKDHLSENWFDEITLRFMDWVGNAPHGVVLPYNYGSRADWSCWFEAAKLEAEEFETRVPLYPMPASAVFGRKLHFVARLTPKS